MKKVIALLVIGSCLMAFFTIPALAADEITVDYIAFGFAYRYFNQDTTWSTYPLNPVSGDYAYVTVSLGAPVHQQHLMLLAPKIIPADSPFGLKFYITPSTIASLEVSTYNGFQNGILNPIQKTMSVPSDGQVIINGRTYKEHIAWFPAAGSAYTVDRFGFCLLNGGINFGMNTKVLMVPYEYSNPALDDSKGQFDDGADELDKLDPLTPPDFNLDLNNDVMRLVPLWFEITGTVLSFTPGMSTILMLSFMIWYLAMIVGFTQRNLSNYAYRKSDRGKRGKGGDDG